MSDYLDPNNEELLKDFFSEAQSQVDSLEQNILVLEGDSTNKDAIDEMFRAAHTLKGGAATVEMGELTHFTHLVEDAFDAIRSDTLKIEGEVVDVLLLAVDIIKAMLQERMNGAVYRGDSSSVEAKLSALLPTSSPSRKTAAKQAKEKPAPAAAKASVNPGNLSEYDILELKEAVPSGSKLFRVLVSFNEDNLMNTVGGIQVYAALKETGSILRTIPDFEHLYEDNFYPTVEYYIASTNPEDYLRRSVLIPDVVLDAEVHLVDVGGAPAYEAAPASRQAAPAPRQAAPAQELAASKSAAPKSAAKTATAKPAQQEGPAPDAEARANHDADAKKAGRDAGSVLRVDSRRIDNLLNLVSETVINKATFNQISSQFGELLGQLQTAEVAFREQVKDLIDALPDFVESAVKGTAIKDIRKDMGNKYADLFNTFSPFESAFKVNVAKFRSTAQNLGRITGELQEGVMRIRMVPISQIFSRFPRLVRDLSKSLDKHVNLVIEGEDTELDKSVIEDLLDPIMHSVRNSLDHGIESVEDRIAAGKPEDGQILLKASNEGNMIIIEIKDDGKGIDVEAVKAKAVERGILHPNKALTDIEAFNLIFEPGFSTSQQITNISGRGVGLDVVRRQIEKLNGTVTVSSEKGKGTKFTIKLPLTLAIIQGLLVRVGQEVYSIPITSVIESHRVKPSDIMMIDNYEVFNVRDEVISLLRLNKLFGIPIKGQGDYTFVVIVGTAEKKVGLMVDSLIGEEDVVIKPLRDQFTTSPGIAGASILGDGSVSLIIDVSQLLDLGQKKEVENRRMREATIG